MNRWILLLATCGIVGAAVAADIDAGRERSAACQSCHGPEGVSLGPAWPNLAGQKAGYLEAQLKAFREGKRKNPLMNAMAADLGDDDIANLAAFFSSLPAGGSGAQASVPAHLAGGKIAFPSGYADSFLAYSKFNRKNGKQVMAVFANQAAVDGMKADGKPSHGAVLIAEVYKIKRSATGEPIVGAHGIWEQGPLAAYVVMEKRSGWGGEIPADLRNGDWNYAVFTPEKKPKGGLNQAPCLACHKPLAEEDYMFTYKDLVKAAK